MISPALTDEESAALPAAVGFIKIDSREVADWLATGFGNGDALPDDIYNLERAAQYLRSYAASHGPYPEGSMSLAARITVMIKGSTAPVVVAPVVPVAPVAPIAPVVPVKPPSVPIVLDGRLVKSSIEENTDTAAKIRIAFKFGAPARVKYFATLKPDDVKTTPAESSSKYGLPKADGGNGEHVQNITDLVAGTEYTYIVQSSDDSGKSWFDVSLLKSFKTEGGTVKVKPIKRSGRVDLVWSGELNPAAQHSGIMQGFSIRGEHISNSPHSFQWSHRTIIDRNLPITKLSWNNRALYGARGGSDNPDYREHEPVRKKGKNTKLDRFQYGLSHSGAYNVGDGGRIRPALYTDDNGQPGSLIVRANESIVPTEWMNKHLSNGDMQRAYHPELDVPAFDQPPAGTITHIVLENENPLDGFTWGKSISEAEAATWKLTHGSGGGCCINGDKDWSKGLWMPPTEVGRFGPFLGDLPKTMRQLNPGDDWTEFDRQVACIHRIGYADGTWCGTTGTALKKENIPINGSNKARQRWTQQNAAASIRGIWVQYNMNGAEQTALTATLYKNGKVIESATSKTHKRPSESRFIGKNFAADWLRLEFPSSTIAGVGDDMAVEFSGPSSSKAVLRAYGTIAAAPQLNDFKEGSVEVITSSGSKLLKGDFNISHYALFDNMPDALHIGQAISQAPAKIEPKTPAKVVNSEYVRPTKFTETVLSDKAFPQYPSKPAFTADGKGVVLARGAGRIVTPEGAVSKFGGSSEYTLHTSDPKVMWWCSGNKVYKGAPDGSGAKVVFTNPSGSTKKIHDLTFGTGEGKVQQSRYVVLADRDNLFSVDLQRSAIIATMKQPTFYDWASFCTSAKYIVIKTTDKAKIRSILRYSPTFESKKPLWNYAQHSDFTIDNGDDSIVLVGYPWHKINIATGKRVALKGRGAHGHVSMSKVPGVGVFSDTGTGEVALFDLETGYDGRTIVAKNSGSSVHPYAVISPDGNCIVYRTNRNARLETMLIRGS